MRITTDNWRRALLSRGTPPPRYTLMAVEWQIDVSTEDNYVIGVDQFPMWADAWFIVPAHLAKAYEAARTTLLELEHQIDEWYALTEHRKNIRRGVEW